MLPGTVIAAWLMFPVFWNPRLPLVPVNANAAPPKLFACVNRLILPADAKLLVVAVNTPLSVMPPVPVAVNVPPTLEVPRFSAAASMVALPVAPVVFRDTAPLNVFAAPKVMVSSAVEVVKLPVVAEMAPACVIEPVSEISVMLPGTIVAARLIFPVFWNPRLPLVPLKANVAPGKLFACVNRLMLPADAKLLAGAVNTPLSVMPLVPIAVNVPPTVEVPRLSAAASMLALPVAPVVFRETGPEKALAGVANAMVPLVVSVVKVAAPAAIAPVCAIPPVVASAVSAPPTLDAPRFSAAATMLALPAAPLVFRETGPEKALAGVANA
ncbi:MAG: hypothetical protein WA803_16340, partial [Steroidobacteraceae bacterium]